MERAGRGRRAGESGGRVQYPSCGPAAASLSALAHLLSGAPLHGRRRCASQRRAPAGERG